MKKCMNCNTDTYYRKYCSRKCRFEYEKINKIGFWNSESQSKLAKRAGLKNVSNNLKLKLGVFSDESKRRRTESNRKNHTSFCDSHVQQKLAFKSIIALRKNVRQLKFYGHYYDSIPEIEISLCLQYQYNYKPKEGKTLHIRIGNCEYDYLLDKLFIEYHVFWKIATEQYFEYYKRRRKNLNTNGYEDYSLIVIK